jgi:hypothetical protein
MTRLEAVLIANAMVLGSIVIALIAIAQTLTITPDCKLPPCGSQNLGEALKFGPAALICSGEKWLGVKP